MKNRTNIDAANKSTKYSKKMILMDRGNKQSESKINILQQRLKESCREDETGILKPNRIMNCMNSLQKEDCPDAYQPEMVINFRIKQEYINHMKSKKEQEELDRDNIDKTLFDFDDDIDNLSDVEDRWLANDQKYQQQT